jgi:hypothetical protein
MPDPITNITVVPVNEGVTTCVLGFLLVCLIFPSLVRNRPQYYAALAMIVAVILLHALSMMIRTAGFQVFAGVVTGVLQAMAILMIVLCVGGLRLRELADDLKDAYEVMRRGESGKELIIPRRGGAVSVGTVERARPSTEEDRTVYRIDPETGEDVPLRPEEGEDPKPKSDA